MASSSLPWPSVNLTPRTLGDLISDITQAPTLSKTTILVVCTTRERFLASLEAYLKHSHSPRTNHDEVVNVSDTDSLLVPRLQLLAASDKVKLVFCSNVVHFRAWLASEPDLFQQAASSDMSGKVTVIDMLSMHHGTSEYTLQGLSRSFALLASTAHQMGLHLDILECEDIVDPQNRSVGSRLWSDEVPLLSGSVKIAEAGRSWASRTMSVRVIASRWFRFVETRVRND